MVHRYQDQIRFQQLKSLGNAQSNFARLFTSTMNIWKTVCRKRILTMI